MVARPSAPPPITASLPAPSTPAKAMLQEGAEKLAALHEAQQGEAAKVVAMKPKG